MLCPFDLLSHSCCICQPFVPFEVLSADVFFIVGCLLLRRFVGKSQNLFNFRNFQNYTDYRTAPRQCWGAIAFCFRSGFGLYEVLAPAPTIAIKKTELTFSMRNHTNIGQFVNLAMINLFTYCSQDLDSCVWPGEGAGAETLLWLLTQTERSFLIKGTVARDFWPLVFFMNRPHMGPLFIT
jgi:hypothetical protein